MSKIRTAILAVLIGLTVLGCQAATQPALVSEQNVESAGDQQIEPVSFNKKLSLQNISFEITSRGEGSIRILTVQPSGLSLDNSKQEMEIEGAVLDAEIEDLNSDGYPELLIYTQSAGSGSYGNVIGYSVNNGKTISQITFPAVSENKKANKGYMGHDQFSIVESSLVQRFPIYKEGDFNASPTGKLRQIEYRLKDGEASRVFVVKSIIEIDK